MNNVLASPRPWSVDREPWERGYRILDAHGNVIGEMFSVSEKRNPATHRRELDMDQAHSNAHLVVNVINQG